MKRYTHPWYEGIGWRNGIWESYLVTEPIEACDCKEKNPIKGTSTVTKWSENNIPSINHYRNCIKCKKAYSATEAAIINRWLGQKVEPLPMPVLDTSFLDDIEL